MDRTETIQRVRGAIAREIGVPVEQTRTDVGLTELARADGFFEEEDIVDVVERELAVCADVIWDGYPQRDRRAEGRIAIVARSLRLLAPFDRRAEDMLPHYAGRYEDPSIDSIAESLIAGRYVPSGLIWIDEIKPLSRAGSLWRVGGKLVVCMAIIPLLPVIFPCNPACQNCDAAVGPGSLLIGIGLGLGLFGLAYDVVPGLCAIRPSGADQKAAYELRDSQN